MGIYVGREYASLSRGVINASVLAGMHGKVVGSDLFLLQDKVKETQNKCILNLPSDRSSFD
jgi:hypothetical protein